MFVVSERENLTTMSNKTTPAGQYPFKIVPFSSDYGFKKVLATDLLFTRQLVQLLAELRSAVQRLDMLRNEFEGITMEARSGVYDVICKDERLNVFILEMQKITLKYLVIRLMFYVFHFFNSQVKQGKHGFKNIPPVRGICILEGNIYPKSKKYFWSFKWRADTGRIFSSAVGIHLVELGKFPILREDFKKVSTDLEKILYTMKYAHLIDIDNPAEVPPFFLEPWIAEALQRLNLAAMSPQERAILDMSIVGDRMLRVEQEEKIEEKFEEGIEIGKEKGIEQGIEQGLHLALQVIQLFREGKTETAIMKQTKLPRLKVRGIIQQFVAQQ